MSSGTKSASGWSGTSQTFADNFAIGFGNSPVTYNFNVTPSAVPEPGIVAFLVSGVSGMGGLIVRRRVRR